MGAIKGIYKEEYPVGTLVQIVSLDELKKFKVTWKYHHPLTEEQYKFSEKTAIVKEVSFYHGGDELYILNGIPGIWHEYCLREV